MKQGLAILFILFAGAAFMPAVQSEEASPDQVILNIPKSVAKAVAYQANTNIIEVLGLDDQALVETVVPVPMRDGIRLSATVIRANGERSSKARFSTILIKTPYAPIFEVKLWRDVISNLIKRGYVIVIVNERGTQWSDGKYHWLKGAKEDGYDTMSWVAAQPWSNGRIGTFGCSSSGEGQIPLATMNHPAHKAMVPMSAATAVGEIPGYDDRGIWYVGGVPQLFWAGWFRYNGHYARPVMPAGISQEARVRIASSYSPGASLPPFKPKYAHHLPSADILKAAGAPQSDFDELIRLSPADEGWKKYDLLRDGESTRVPALHMSSWYDLAEIYPTLKMYEYLARISKDQYLIIGGGQHCAQGTESARTMVGEHDIGDARFDYVSSITNFFDHFVEGDGRGEFRSPPVQFYIMGSSTWQATDRWPVDSIAYRLYLRGNGHANSMWGDGVLDSVPPSMEGVASTFVSDPANPVQSKGSSCCPVDQSADQREVEARHDVLVFTSPPLAEDLLLVGNINAKLFLRSNVRDTDVMFKVVLVQPDGRALNLTETAQRLRYRNGLSRVEFMEPNRTYEVNLKHMVTAIKLLKGYRIRIEIAGTNFPAYERNMNTGGRNFDEPTPRIAMTTIVHDARHPSYVEFSQLREPASVSLAVRRHPIFQ